MPRYASSADQRRRSQTSPWRSGPVCDSANARRSFQSYQENGKACPDCKQRKAASEFHPRKNRAGGLDTYCKPCRRARWRRWAHGEAA